MANLPVSGAGHTPVQAARPGRSAPRKDAEGGTDIAVTPKTKRKTRKKLARPKLYRVLFHNDDYTTREFVVFLLQSVFNKTETDAVAIMLNVHHNGIGTAGIYPHEVAETKVSMVASIARQNEFPLLCSMEPE